MADINVIKKRQIQISHEMLEYLLEYRKNNPDFTFPLRSRDSAQSKEERLSEGLWFQGSNYIFVALFKQGDNERKSKTIGFILDFYPDGSIKSNSISISFKTGINTPEEINFHKELASEIGLTLNDENFGYKQYPNPNDYIENLRDFIESFRPKAIELLKKYDILDKYLVPINEFEKHLNKTLSIRANLAKRENLPPNINDMKHPLNQILYGPPGTGKTYNTINKALEIIGEDLTKKTRKVIKDLFDTKMKEGQIVFTTFHQSMSYEDFIEGIKPIENKGQISYDIVDGIFKKLCSTANSKVAIDFDIAYDKFIKNIGESEEEYFELKTKTNKSYWVSINSNANLNIHTTNLKNFQGTMTKEKLQRFANGENTFGGWEGYAGGLINHLKQKYNLSDVTDNNTKKNFVIIIDEINRGNVSQIFGELITLIEEDKRLGKDEALEVMLPYSKKKFGVPANLYIIGTMNTADRSVEALDAALRRRFSFDEMSPNPSLIATTGKLNDTLGVLDTIDLPLVLETINKRIEKLLDKDHLIGHSYFMSVTNLSDLRITFHYKIIPLLQEYFFGDYGKIGLVLGRDFFEPIDNTSDRLFADFDEYDGSEFAERVIYKLRNISKMKNTEIIGAIQTLLI